MKKILSSVETQSQNQGNSIINSFFESIESYWERGGSAVQWFLEHPEVTWSGIGISAFGIVIALVIYLYKRIQKLLRKKIQSVGSLSVDISTSSQQKTPEQPIITQNHSGSGDNVGRDKIVNQGKSDGSNH